MINEIGETLLSGVDDDAMSDGGKGAVRLSGRPPGERLGGTDAQGSGSYSGRRESAYASLYGPNSEATFASAGPGSRQRGYLAKPVARSAPFAYDILYDRVHSREITILSLLATSLVTFLLFSVAIMVG